MIITSIIITSLTSISLSSPIGLNITNAPKIIDFINDLHAYLIYNKTPTENEDLKSLIIKLHENYNKMLD